MRVLFTNWHYSMLGGSQTWIYTAAKALVEAGHEAAVWAGGLGILSEMTSPFAPCSTDLADLGEWDVCWGSHQIVGNVPARGPRCQIVHATQNQDQEAPVPGLDAYFAVSEEVAEFIEQRGFPCAGIIRQPVDTDRFISTTPVRSATPRVLHFGNYQHWLPVVAEACAILDLPFAVVGGPKDDEGRRWDVEVAINDADIVVGQTRCVLEAMACERNAIVCSGWAHEDGYGLDGFVTPQGYHAMRRNNLTGNSPGELPTVAALVRELRRYDPALGPTLRAEVVRSHEPITALQPLIAWSADMLGRQP
jgi:hypothetical protein